MLRIGLKKLIPACAGAGLLAGVDFFLPWTWGPLAGRAELLGIGWAATWLTTLAVLFAWSLLRRGQPISRAAAFWLGVALAEFPLLVGLGIPLWAATPLFLGGLWWHLRDPLPAPSRTLCTFALAGMVAWVLATPWLAIQGEHPSQWKPSPGPAVPEGSPDVVLVSIDTCRADAVFGPLSASTPLLDRLRAEGLASPWALSGSNQTLPGHMGMLTGLDAMSHGLRENREMPSTHHQLLAERMQKAGWATFGVVSNPLMGAEFGWTRGFDAFDDSLVLRGRLRPIHHGFLEHGWAGWIFGPKWTRRALSWTYADPRSSAQEGLSTASAVVGIALEQVELMAEQEAPFFLFLHFMDPHSPYEAPAASRTRRSKDARHGVASRFLPAEGDRVVGAMLIELEAALKKGDEDAESALEWYRSLYLEEIAEVDRALVGLMEKLESGGRPTIVLVTGDHGEHFGEQGWMRHANTLLEPNLRVPFILWAPGRVKPGAIQGVPHLADVVPTLLALAGIPLPENLDGRPVHLGPLPTRPHVATDEDQIAVRWQGWKWTGNWTGGTPASTRLVNLDEDPGEDVNRVEGSKVPLELAEKISTAVSRDQHSSLFTGGGGPSAAHQALLEELGYAGDG